MQHIISWRLRKIAHNSLEYRARNTMCLISIMLQVSNPPKNRLLCLEQRRKMNVIDKPGQIFGLKCTTDIRLSVMQIQHKFWSHIFHTTYSLHFSVSAALSQACNLWGWISNNVCSSLRPHWNTLSFGITNLLWWQPGSFYKQLRKLFIWSLLCWNQPAVTIF